MPEPPTLPPIATQPLSILLLANSDQPGFEKAVNDWVSQVDSLDPPHEVLLLDDAMADRTEELSKRWPGLRILRDPDHRGVGPALRLGLKETSHPLLCYASCGSGYRPSDLAVLMKEIDKTHVVVGHRVGRAVPLPARALGLFWRLFWRIVIGLPMEPLPAWLGWRTHVRNLATRYLFGLRLHDPQCDFRLFRREIFQRIPIQSDGPFAHVEILAKANFLTAVMTEVPVHQIAEPSESWWREAWRVFRHPDFGPAKLPEQEPEQCATAKDLAPARRP
jgi:hypothetical protein